MCIYYLDFLLTPDPYDAEVIKRYDQMLHLTLQKIFRKRSLTRRSVRTNELLNSSEHRDSIIKLILEQEPGLGEVFPNFPDGKKFSLLWSAVLLCCQKSAELLAQSGADVNERLGFKLGPKFVYNSYFNEKTTILQGLLRMHPSSWNERFIGLVMEHSADLNARDSDGSTALHFAVRESRVKETKMFLEKGVNVNAATNYGKTPLLTAVSSAVVDEVMQPLLEHGADVRLRDAGGWNVLHHLASARMLITVEESCNQARVLIEKGASLDDRCVSTQYQPLHQALYNRKVALAKLFLEHGANVNAREKSSIFPLYIAAGYNKTDRCNISNIMTALLERGADIDMKTIQGRTALHIACQRLNEEGINTLLCFGADMHLEDNYGYTPFSLMMNKADDANASIRQILRKLALKTACMHPSIASKNERCIKEHPKLDSELLNYYQDCVEQIRKANATRFIGTFTFLDLLTKCQCEIAPLMRNREFKSIFELKHNVFSEYSDSLRETVDLIEQQYYRPTLQLEDEINEAFYNTLPHMIVRKLVYYVHGCNVCKIRKMVKSSRGSCDNCAVTA